MAAWLEDHLPAIVQQYLERAEQGELAKAESRPTIRIAAVQACPASRIEPAGAAGDAMPSRPEV